MKRAMQFGEYVSPQVEQFDLNVERGFADSGPASGDGTLLNFEDGGDI